MTIIPAIDIINGKCVRLAKGDYSRQTVYDEDPLDMAMRFADAGLQRLHLVDLDGARSGEVKNWKVLENIATKTSLLIDFSGGISSEKNLAITFNSGASYASIGSMAVKQETIFEIWVMAYGAGKFIIGADTKDERIMVKGWTETSAMDVYDLIGKNITRGIYQFFCTDINKDGLLQGPAIALYKSILEKYPSIDLIASGGVSSVRDLHELKEIGCAGAIIGKAIYENKISLTELQTFL